MRRRRVIKTRSISLSTSFVRVSLSALFYLICVSICCQPLSNIHSNYPKELRYNCSPPSLMFAKANTPLAAKCPLSKNMLRSRERHIPRSVATCMHKTLLKRGRLDLKHLVVERRSLSDCLPPPLHCTCKLDWLWLWWWQLARWMDGRLPCRRPSRTVVSQPSSLSVYCR